MMPAPIASTAEISDHQKPGICRAQNVSASPAMPRDQEHPAEEDRDGEARQRRRDHGGEAEDDEQDAFDQKGLPVLAHRGAHFGLQFGDVLGNGHCKSPGAGNAE